MTIYNATFDLKTGALDGVPVGELKGAVKVKIEYRVALPLRGLEDQSMVIGLIVAATPGACLEYTDAFYLDFEGVDTTTEEFTAALVELTPTFEKTVEALRRNRVELLRQLAKTGAGEHLILTKFYNTGPL